MVLVNPVNVLLLLTALINQQQYQKSQITGAEQDLANSLYNIILESVYDPHFEIEEIITHDISSSAEFPSAQLVDVFEDDDVNYDIEDEFLPAEVEVNMDSQDIDNSYKKNAVEFWTSGKKGRLSLHTVQNRYRQVTSLRQLHRWEQQVTGGGSRREKLYKLSQVVLEKFKQAKDRQMIIHDSDLKRWALEAQSKLNIPNFEVSSRWIQRFKSKHNIVSRKITKYRTKTSQSDFGKIQIHAENFVRNVRDVIPEYGLDNIYNSDQSGFTLELRSGRSLAECGVKKVEAVVQSVSATTHSYTIQPTISASGKLLSPLFLCLKEPTGNLGPRVEATVFRPRNIYLVASKSGKLSKELLHKWITDVYSPNVGHKTLLLLDSWTGQNPEDAEDAVPLAKQVNFMTIPAGTTGMIQPLDVYGFRLWKQFVRQLSDIIVLSENHCHLQLPQRNNIIKLQSLTHNQFSSPRYTELFQYSWHKSGYIDERPGVFQTPSQFSFGEKVYSTCSICGSPAIIRCGWCKQHFCLKHFFEEYHYCTTYVP